MNEVKQNKTKPYPEAVEQPATKQEEKNTKEKINEIEETRQCKMSNNTQIYKGDNGTKENIWKQSEAIYLKGTDPYEYVQWKLKQSLLITNQNNRAKALQECLDYCISYKKQCIHMIPVIEDHLIDAKLKPLF